MIVAAARQHTVYDPPTHTSLSFFCKMNTLFSGIVRVAVLPQPWDKESEDMLMRHAYAYPRGGNVAFEVHGDEMEMRSVPSQSVSQCAE